MKGRKQSPEHIAKRFESRSRTIAARTPGRILDLVDKKGLDECWPWLGSIRENGYGYTEIDGKKYLAHRVIFVLANPGTIEFRGPKQDSKEATFVLHNCDNPICCNPNHLRAGTHKENIGDAVKRNRYPKWEGADHPRCKLTEEEIREVRKLRESGVTGRKVARLFSVSPQTISSIMVGRYYGEIL
jgi:hypothetical protein